VAELTVNGVRLGIDEAGTGSPAFVFVHGLACDRQAWKPQFDDLSRDHRCISVDLRGCGESAAEFPCDVETAAADVAALIEAKGLAPAIVVGHSLGGLVALVLNERRPELVLGIVVGDSPIGPGGFETTPTLVERIVAAGSMQPITRMVDGFFTEATPPEVAAYAREVMLNCDARVGAGMLDGFPAIGTRMKELVQAADKKPFMAIWAGRPAGDPAWLRDITLFLRQEPITDTGHFFQLEQPAITNALLRAFLDDVERDPRVSAI